MDDNRKKELLDIVSHFRGKPVNGNVITEYCNLMGYDPIGEGDLEDFTYAVTMEERVNEAWPKIVAILATWRYLGELSSESAQLAQYESIENQILQVLEETGFQVRDVRWITRELSKVVAGMIANASGKLDDKIVAVQNAWSKERFGKESVLDVPASKWAEECGQLAGK